ncbi:protein CLMP1-like [Zingiber officinale]|uniref:protein CLMP1-like n=1 Tax=Zingiber officinale TaxID=94328 RepID=UPI001C4D2D8A|nr:protein CLMP1-like [Zingiber officinale]XP_042448395.1 protein CLMP1-like [Zingiber officinale]XP_042448396.1 protein CLMP1-like [Zingiber officinale]XP_042448398.1 protein CLMP1-like [Zingiber officinale]
MGKSGDQKKKKKGSRAAAASGTPASASTPTPTPTPTPPPPPPPSHPPPPAPSNGVVEVDVSLLLKRAHELKEEGNRLFQAKDYGGALGQYEIALKLTPRGHPDRAVFHSNRAACLMQMRPVDHEAVAAECSLALQAQPGFPRALLRRARALEALCRYDLALEDVHSLLALDSSHPDALDLARRLRAAVAPAAPSDPGSRPSPAALGASAVQVGIPISGLGPCLPARSKKASTPPQPSLSANKPTVPSQNDHCSNSPSLSNGPQIKPFRLVPFKPSNGEASSQSSQVVSPRGSSRQSVKKEVSLEAAVIRWRPLKLVYDHDIRLAQMQANCTFKGLREIVANRYPSSKSVLIKYKDADGDLITVTSTAELRLAESFVDELNKKEVKEGSGVDKDDKLQLLRLHIMEVSPEQEPQVPEEEEKLLEEEGQNIDQCVSDSVNDDSIEETVNNEVIRMGSEAEEVVKDKIGVSHKGCDHPECKEVEIDDWLYEFAQLFRNQIGIDPEAHLDLHELGMELCSEALEETVTGEEAQGLFDMAAAKFQEVAALSFFNWGNVHMCAARKRIPLDESAPEDVMAAQLQTAYDWVSERYALAGKKYEEALRIKPDFYEGLLALGQQEFETAKLHWSFALAKKLDLSTWDSSETIRLFDGAEKKMNAATEMWEKVEQQRINELKDPGKSKEDELLKKRKKQRAADGQGELSTEEAAEQAAAMRSQIHLFWGNMLFERSQVEFKLGFGDWKKNLDAAVERFKLAGAAEGDISTVLKKHASNETEADFNEKKITISSNAISEANSKDVDKHMLENCHL